MGVGVGVGFYFYDLCVLCYFDYVSFSFVVTFFRFFGLKFSKSAKSTVLHTSRGPPFSSFLVFRFQFIIFRRAQSVVSFFLSKKYQN